MPSSPEFTRVLVRCGSRLLIESSCRRCGVSRLVSQHDGSRQEWEDGHRCEAAQPEKKGPQPATGKTPAKLRKIAGGKHGGKPPEAS